MKSPPDAERGAASAPTETLLSSSPADHEHQQTDTTARLRHDRSFAELERRVQRLEIELSRRRERAGKRQPKGCTTNAYGEVFMPGVGWIPNYSRRAASS
jgi:hypothetical protein